MRPFFAISLLLVVFLAPAQAEPPACGDYLHIWWNGLCNQVWSCKQPCPDDYCKKCFPAADPRAKCGENDYCNKPFPLLDPRAPCGVDDYHGKACPKIEPLCHYPPWYQCTPCPANPVLTAPAIVQPH